MKRSLRDCHFGMECFRQLPRASALGALLFTAFLIQCQVNCHYVLVSVKRTICTSPEGEEGVCMQESECIKRKGMKITSCAFATCCFINDTKSKEATTQSPSTYTTESSLMIKTTRVPDVRSTNSNYGKNTKKSNKRPFISTSESNNMGFNWLPSKFPTSILFSTKRTTIFPTTQEDYSFEERLSTEKTLVTESTTRLTSSSKRIHSSELPLDLIRSTALKSTVAPSKLSFTSKAPYSSSTLTPINVSYKWHPSKFPTSILFSTKRTTIFPTTQEDYSFEERLTTEKPLLTESTTGSTYSGISIHSSDLPLDLMTSTTLKSSLHSTSPCGWPILYHEKKVVGGRNSTFRSWTWQVSVGISSCCDNHLCGGALIHPQWVHCVNFFSLKKIIIRMENYDLSYEEEPHGHANFSVKKVVIHPGYNGSTLDNNIALAQLENPIDPVQYPHIKPICLPPSDEDFIGKNAFVTGRGRLCKGSTCPTVLQVHAHIVNNEKCKTTFVAVGRHDCIPDIFLCVDFEEGGRDSYEVDSGGLLQIQTRDGYWFLAGISSWYISCSKPNMPKVYTRISKFKDWIVEQVD